MCRLRGGGEGRLWRCAAAPRSTAGRLQILGTRATCVFERNGRSGCGGRQRGRGARGGAPALHPSIAWPGHGPGACSISGDG